MRKTPEASICIKRPLWVVWRAAALQMQSESGDMCGGFGPLAVQGFLALFPARETRRGREGNSVHIRKRTLQADFFDMLTGALQNTPTKKTR